MFKLNKFLALLGKERIVAFATLGKIGSLKAPGTFGSLAGILFFTVALFYASLPVLVLYSLVSAYIAVGVCDLAESYIGVKDPHEVILDEFVAIPFCFWGINLNFGSGNFIIVALAFGLFRLFDITKPLFINKLQELKGGLGCVADDIAAALTTCVCLHVIIKLFMQ